MFLYMDEKIKGKGNISIGPDAANADRHVASPTNAMRRVKISEMKRGSQFWTAYADS